MARCVAVRRAGSKSVRNQLPHADGRRGEVAGRQRRCGASSNGGSRPPLNSKGRSKDAGLVSERAGGTRRVYWLIPAGVAALRDQLDTYWQRALAGYTDVAEEATEKNA
jgi:hypothetical protein